jgi:arylsulfatase A-like enzyme
MLSALDDSIGSVLAKLRETGLEEKTLIVFVSDNGGPEKANASDNGAFNGVKGTVYEGGVRVPFFVQWKGKLPKGVTREQLAATIDIFPTAIAAAGIEAPKSKALDGINLLPAALDANATSRDSLFWRFGPQWAVRDGKWKLAKLPAAVASEPQLFDLSGDPGETTDVASANPTVLASLKAKYDGWNKDNQEPKWKTGAGAGSGARAGGANGARRQARLAAQGQQKTTELNQQSAPAATDKAAAPQAK